MTEQPTITGSPGPEAVKAAERWAAHAATAAELAKINESIQELNKIVREFLDFMKGAIE